MLDGHHNLAAARMRGVEPDWRGPSAKTRRIIKQLGAPRFARLLITPLTDADGYFVNSGEVAAARLGLDKDTL